MMAERERERERIRRVRVCSDGRADAVPRDMPFRSQDAGVPYQ